MIVDLQLRVPIIPHLRVWAAISAYQGVNDQEKENA